MQDDSVSFTFLLEQTVLKVKYEIKYMLVACIYFHIYTWRKTTNKKLTLQNVLNMYAEFVHNIPADGYKFLWRVFEENKISLHSLCKHYEIFQHIK